MASDALIPQNSLPEELAIDSPLRGAGVAEIKEQSPEDMLRVSAIKHLQTRAQQDRVNRELMWELCLDYVNGELFMLRNKWTGELTRFRVGENRTAFSKNNAIRPINRTLKAKLARLIPTWAVQRATTDYEELFAARACEALLQFIWHNKHMDAVFVEMLEYLTVLGDAFIIPEWSMDVGKPIAFCPQCELKGPADSVGKPCPRCQQEQMQAQALAQQQAMLEQQQQLEAAQMQENLSAVNTVEGQMSGLDTVNGPSFASDDAGQFMGIASNPLDDGSGAAALDVVPPPATSDVQPANPSPTSSSTLVEPGTNEAPAWPEGAEESAASEEAVPMMEPGHSGGVVLKVYPAWEGYPEPNVKQVERMGWFITSERVPVHEARRRYMDHGRYIHADTLASDINAFKFLNNPLPDINGYVTIYKYIERGTALTPSGRILHIVNDMVVQQDLNCVCDVVGSIPVCHFKFEPDLKQRSCWSRSWILDGHHHQRELNSLETLIKEYGEKHVRFKMLTPHGSNIREEDLTGPNVLVKFNPTIGKCEPIQLNQLPEAVFQRRGLLVSDMRAEAGVSEMDAMNTSDPNARAASIAQAEGMAEMKPILVNLYSEWCKLAYIILAMYQRYGDPDETYSAIGGETPEIFSLRDVRLTPGFDVVVEVEDGLSTTQPVRLQEATQLAALGNGVLFQDPTTGQFDVAAFAQYSRLKLPNIRPDQQSTEYAAAMQMISTVVKGGQAAPQPEDDPAIFQFVLLRWLRGKGRRMLLQNEPNAQQIVQGIQQLYSFYLAQERQQHLQMIADQAAQGVPAQGEQPQGPQGQGGPGNIPSQRGQPGTQNQLQSQGQQTGSDVLKQAGDTVKAADQHGEILSRQQQKHEG